MTYEELPDELKKNMEEYLKINCSSFDDIQVETFRNFVADMFCDMAKGVLKDE
jgi:hypothetical protein